MKKVYLFLFCAVFCFAACNRHSEEQAVSKKSGEHETHFKNKVKPQDFFEALRNDSGPRVEEMLKAGADTNAIEPSSGLTPLEIAAMFNTDPRVMVLLINYRANALYTDPVTKANVLIKAAGRLTPRQIKILLAAGVDPNAKDLFGRTAIISAAPTNTDAGAFLEIISAGGDVNARSKEGWSALDYALRTNKSPDVIKILLRYGAHPKDEANAKELSLALKSNLFLKNKGLEKMLAQAKY